MGSSASFFLASYSLNHFFSAFHKMAPMKAMKKTGKAMTKGAIAASLATEFEIKQNVASKIIASLADIGAAEVKKNGVFTFPGLCKIKTRVKPATKACKKEIFGKLQLVKAKPARTVVKAFPVAALKKSV